MLAPIQVGQRWLTPSGKELLVFAVGTERILVFFGQRSFFVSPSELRNGATLQQEAK